ncbi:hypothetical protein E4U38_001613 [Claviceps purpurea]|nr:hypothetical protein E4U38_001613 [Claviceps purpurea]
MRFYVVLSALAGLALADLNQNLNDNKIRDVQTAIPGSVNDNKRRDEQDAVTTPTFVNDARSNLAVFVTSHVEGEKGLDSAVQNYEEFSIGQPSTRFVN